MSRSLAAASGSNEPASAGDLVGWLSRTLPPYRTPVPTNQANGRSHRPKPIVAFALSGQCPSWPRTRYPAVPRDSLCNHYPGTNTNKGTGSTRCRRVSANSGAGISLSMKPMPSCVGFTYKENHHE